MQAETKTICRLSEIADPGSLAFTAGHSERPLRGFVVRRGAEVFAYINRCPHAGHSLNWDQDQFLTSTRTLILCCSHGAQFMIDTGLCVTGPCVGSVLTRIAVRVEHDNVLLDGDPEVIAKDHV